MKQIEISPATIEIILYYHYDGSGEDFRDSPHFRETAKMLVNNNMLLEIEDGRRQYEPNLEAVNVYIDYLCKVQFPVQKYVML